MSSLCYNSTSLMSIFFNKQEEPVAKTRGYLGLIRFPL